MRAERIGEVVPHRGEDSLVSCGQNVFPHLDFMRDAHLVPRSLP